MKLTEIQQKALDNLPIKALNSMQKEFIEASVKENNLVLLSPTGTGKTFAFLLALLQKTDWKKRGEIQALIITPSRELATQIETVFKSFKLPVKINSVYGGHKIKTEVNNFIEPPTILVGTPGRVEDHINRKNFDTSTIHTLVLDEFDKSLELGFQEEIKHIVSRLPNLKNRLLTSATNLKNKPKYLGAETYKEINYLQEQKVKGLELWEVRAEENDKLEVLIRLIGEIGNEPTLIFCNHREAVDRIARLLTKTGIPAGLFHGGLTQNERERALVKFRNGSVNLLVTTDLASRGLDIPSIKNIIHYQLPPKEDAYIHRNGRTARMQEKGSAYLVFSEDEIVPEYIQNELKFKDLEEELFLPEAPQWKTLYIGGGKKDKINKIDVVGFLIKKGNLAKEDIGKIEVFDNMIYVAICAEKAEQVLQKLHGEKIKKKRCKIALSK